MNATDIKTITQSHTYRHTFKDGTRATLTLPAFAVEWCGKPTPGLLPEYLAWRGQCLDHFAELTGLTIAVITV